MAYKEKTNNYVEGILQYINTYSKIHGLIQQISQFNAPTSESQQLQTILHCQSSQISISQTNQKTFQEIWLSLKDKIQHLSSKQKIGLYERTIKIKQFTNLFESVNNQWKQMMQNRSKAKKKSININFVLNAVKLIEEIRDHLKDFYEFFYRQSPNKITVIQQHLQASINQIINLSHSQLLKKTHPVLIPSRPLSFKPKTGKFNTQKSIQYFHEGQKINYIDFSSRKHQLQTLATTRPSTSKRSYFSKYKKDHFSPHNQNLKEQPRDLIETENKQKQIFLSSFIEEKNSNKKKQRSSKIFKRSQTAKLRKFDDDSDFKLTSIQLKETKRMSVMEEKINEQILEKVVVENSTDIGRTRKSKQTKLSNNFQRKDKNDHSKEQTDIFPVRRSERRLAHIIQEPEQLEKHNEEIRKDNPILYQDISSKISHVTSEITQLEFDYNSVTKSTKRRNRLTGSILNRKRTPSKDGSSLINSQFDPIEIENIVPIDLKKSDKRKKAIKKINTYSSFKNSIGLEIPRTSTCSTNKKSNEEIEQKQVIPLSSNENLFSTFSFPSNEPLKTLQKKLPSKPIRRNGIKKKQSTTAAIIQNQEIFQQIKFLNKQSSESKINSQKILEDLDAEPQKKYSYVSFAEAQQFKSSLKWQLEGHNNILGGQNVENSVFFLEQQYLERKEVKKMQKYLQVLRNTHGILYSQPQKIETVNEDVKKKRVLEKERVLVFREETAQLRNCCFNNGDELHQKTLSSEYQI